MPIFTHVIKKRGRFDRAFHFIKLIYSGCHLKEFFITARRAEARRGSLNALI